jgi:negative regulator of sigma E activity
VNRDEQESQLSAMFDGELPAAECELLSRRLTREENLRATWSRYAVIGAALRAEPVARVNPNFARRVSAGLQAAPAAAASAPRVARPWRSAALGAGLAAGVAGAAIMLLRSGLPVQDDTLVAYSPTVARAALPRSASIQSVTVVPRAAPAFLPSGSEPASYVVPPRSSGNTPAMSASLANYALAHSAVSSPLARGSLLSTLIGNESVAPVDATEPATAAAEGTGAANPGAANHTPRDVQP